MLGLWLFGSRIEELWGPRTFTWYYLGSGIAAAFALRRPRADRGSPVLVPMVGASGAIYGILLAFGLRRTSSDTRIINSC